MQSYIFFMSLVMPVLFSPTAKQSGFFEPVAVVELFTSQGCSSCPPADQLLSQTISSAKKDGKNIFALSFHVDYWNRLGWTDPFSEKKYSDRQGEYAVVLNPRSVYTPQMIVNGSTEFVGSSKTSLSGSLSEALKTSPTARFKKLMVSQTAENPLHIYFELEGSYSQSDVKVALVSLKETTNIQRGENGGRILINEHVVRQFVSVKATATGEVDFAASPIPVTGNRIIVAFIQHHDDLKIIGAASAVF